MVEQQKKIKPMTRIGYSRLRDEFLALRDKERPKVVQGVATAAAEGDRSENAEYIYGKKRLREIDKRLGYLTRLLKDVRVINPEEINSDKIGFGATVLVRDLTGVERSFRIVGVGEVEENSKEISIESPVAKGLLGKKVGDFVLLEVPSGHLEFDILQIKYI